MNKKTAATVMVLAIIVLSPIASAAEDVCSIPQQGPAQAGSPQAVGEWEFKSQMPTRASTATMTIKKNAKGRYEGTWSAPWGESALSDITFKNGGVKFVQTSKFGEREMKTEYEGTVEDGKITGKAQGQWGDFTFEGTLQGEAKKGDDAIVGEWQMSVTMVAREIVEKLIITENADGTLAGKWEAQRGESTISDVKFEGGKLTFTRTRRFGDREFTMTFEGTVEGDNIEGVFRSERGEFKINATRITSAKAGKKPAEVKEAEPNTPAGEKKD